MSFIFEDYKPPPITNLRERWLKRQLEQVAANQKAREVSLDAAVKRGSVSRSYIDVNRRELEVTKNLSQKLRDGLEAVRLQNAAERKAERELSEQTPLERTRTRRGFYRSSKDREAAILGAIERERRQSAPLTREAWSRAKAIAASRRYYDPEESQLRGRRGTEYIPSDRDIAKTQTGFDPCLEKKKVRRQVMFAQQTAGRGYSTPKRWGPC